LEWYSCLNGLEYHDVSRAIQISRKANLAALVSINAVWGSFEMLKKMMGKMYVGMMRKQMEAFVTGLKDADGDEIAGVVLMALDISNTYKTATGADLFEPAISVGNNPSLIIELSTRAE